MSQEPNQPPQNQNRGDGDRPPDAPSGGFNWRGMMLLLIACMLIGLALFSQVGGGFGGKQISSAKFKALAKEGLIVADLEKFPIMLRLTEGSDKSYIAGTYVPEEKKKNATEEDYENFSALVHMTMEAEKNLYQLLKDSKPYGVPEGEAASLHDYLVEDVKTSYGPMIIFTFLPILLILLILYFLFRHQMKMAGRGAMSFGKSKARMMSLDKNKVTFKNVAGVDEAKEEVWEIVEFLSGEDALRTGFEERFDNLLYHIDESLDQRHLYRLAFERLEAACLRDPGGHGFNRRTNPSPRRRKTLPCAPGILEAAQQTAGSQQAEDPIAFR